MTKIWIALIIIAFAIMLLPKPVKDWKGAKVLPESTIIPVPVYTTIASVRNDYTFSYASAAYYDYHAIVYAPNGYEWTFVNERNQPVFIINKFASDSYNVSIGPGYNAITYSKYGIYVKGE